MLGRAKLDLSLLCILGLILFSVSGCQGDHYCEDCCGWKKLPFRQNHPSATAPDKSASTALTTTSTTATAAPQPSKPDPLRKMARSIQAEVAEIIGLAYKHPVMIKVVDKSELIGIFKKEFSREITPQEMSFEQRSLIRFGFAPPGFDLRQTAFQMLHDNVAGFYLPHQKELYLIRGLPNQAVIASHELTHALQDQYFDLETNYNNKKKDADVLLAFQAVAEGEATLLMREFAVRRRRRGEGKSFAETLQALMQAPGQLQSLKKIPLVMSEKLMFPYTSGLDFVSEAFRRGGWLGVRHLYSQGPQSSEQILHPDKFFLQLDQPTRIVLLKFTDFLPGNWQEAGQNTLGELNCAILLKTLLPEGRDVATAARGWDGDRYVLLDAVSEEDPSKKHSGLVWLSTWDSARHAQRFLQTYQEALGTHFGKAPQAQTAQRSVWQVTRKRRVFLTRWGQEVLLLDGFTEQEEVLIRKRISQRKKNGSLFSPDHRADATPPKMTFDF